MGRCLHGERVRPHPCSLVWRFGDLGELWELWSLESRQWESKIPGDVDLSQVAGKQVAGPPPPPGWR